MLDKYKFRILKSSFPYIAGSLKGDCIHHIQ